MLADLFLNISELSESLIKKKKKTSCIEHISVKKTIKNLFKSYKICSDIEENLITFLPVSFNGVHSSKPRTSVQL